MFDEQIRKEQLIIDQHFQEDRIIAEDQDNQKYVRSASDIEYEVRQEASHTRIKNKDAYLKDYEIEIVIWDELNTLVGFKRKSLLLNRIVLLDNAKSNMKKAFHDRIDKMVDE